jgi:pSer/pThr/pTyr-binding forkhead associated (FHA) protein
MQLILEATTGPHLGKKIVVRAGQTATFGRTERADYTFPLDEQMSGLHFSLEHTPPDCRIRDLGSANGTFLGGARVQDALLQPGDAIRAGSTAFTVTFPPPGAKTEQIPDYLKHIVPPGAGISESAHSTGFGEHPEDIAPLSPPPLPPQVSFAPLPTTLPAGGTYAPSPPNRLSASLSGTLRLEVEVIGGPHVGTRFSLRSGDSVQVGRTDLADLVLAGDSSLSRMHFAISSTPRGFELSDLGSTNGTLLNGETVVAALLADGDEFHAGQSQFKVRLEGATATASPDISRGATALLGDGVRDPDLFVRREALFAAAWTRQSWLMAHCRKLAENPLAKHWDALVMLAVLGKPSELSRIEALGRAETLGPRRLLLYGTLGHPALVGKLLEVMAGPDSALAAAAGLAYAKIAGVDITSPRRAEVVLKPGAPPSDLFLPEVDKAHAHWKQMQEKFAGSTRVCRGYDLSDRVGDDVFAELDMESRWEVRLRGRFYGTWQGSMRDFES